MRTSERGRELIKAWEGLRLEAYLCPGNVWTIGYGHTGRIAPPPVTAGMKIGRGDAERFLDADLAVIEKQVLEAVKVPLEQHQFDVLVSFVFNLGIGALRRSTLLKVLNNGAYDQVPAQLQRWVFAGGVEVPGLRQRRRAEARVWVDGWKDA